MAVELTEILLARIAGWDTVKLARAVVSGGRVLKSEWAPPRLTGTVQGGRGPLATGLVIHDAVNVDNLCTCRTARERGIICEHAVAVGIHWIRSQQPALAAVASKAAAPPPKPVKRLRRAASGESADAAALHIIVPPNFAQAAAKGKVMLCVEAEWAGERAPLNTLPPGEPFAFDEFDAAFLDAWESAVGEPAGMAILTTAQFAELLPCLAGHPRVTLGKSQALTISTEPQRLAVTARLLDNGEITLTITEGGLQAPPAPAGKGASKRPEVRAPEILAAGGAAWVWDAIETLRPLGLPAGLDALLAGPVKVPRSRVPQFLNLDWPRLVAGCDVDANFAAEDFELEPAPPRFQLHLAGGLAMLSAKLECFYGDKSVVPGVATKDDAVWLPDPDAPTRYRTRNLAAEQEAVARFTRHGFTGPDAKGCWNVKGQDQVLAFFAREFPRIEKEWRVTLEERLERSTEQNLERVEPRFAVTPSGEQWFDLVVNYQTSGGDQLTAADVQSLLLGGRGIGKSKRGKFLLVDTGAVEELQQVLLEASPQQRDGAYRLDNAQAGFIEATLRQQGFAPQAPAAWRERVAQQRGELKPALPPLGELEPVLRPYQKEGVAWLHFLRVNGFGGVLADEMGLGKTLQVLALLSSCRSRRKEAHSEESPIANRQSQRSQSLLTSAPTNLVGPSLVVCPTSLVHNWAAEAAKFTPGLRVLAVHGPQRAELFAQLPQADLVVTSYALLRRDFERYRALEFDTVVLDEAQHIKNRATQNAQAVKALRSRHRLVLTGTPIENSVLDLWSLFDFLMPGYLGAARDFRERYELPLSKGRDAALQDRLARRVRPFILRRLKREVAADLPEKIEQVSYCDLTEEQRAVYQQLLEAGRREVFGAVEKGGLAKSRMVVLTTLLRLRQVCCDLRLLRSGERSDGVAESWSDGVPAPANTPALQHSSTPSAKLEIFAELLDEILDGGHRALVFSQFTTMLGLLREHLDTAGVGYCYLDGATKNRAEVVEKFQRDGRIPVFLISLKAGGTGLNLTGADTVIHFDPWWNPAVEAQATDRAHRIGQRRVVTSYKLIARGTVEEKILNLQQRKRALIQGMLGEETFAENLSWEEIQDLLKE
jgi:superfamily II DNA or RNA helicase